MCQPGWGYLSRTTHKNSGGLLAIEKIRYGAMFSRIVKLLKLVYLGFAGGWFFGFIFLAFGILIGRSGNVPEIDPDLDVLAVEIAAAAGLALIYGAPLGTLLFPSGYLVFLRKIPFRLGVIWSALGTLGGGLLGALVAPPAALLAGVFGFFCGCIAANAIADSSD